MSFDALPEEAAQRLARAQRRIDATTSPPDIGDLLTQPDEDNGNGPADRHVDSKLQTNLEEEKLHKRLLSIHNDARTYIEEQGVNILFLALGFLHWFESDSATEPRRAPLVLIPVELERMSAKERFRVRYTEEDLGDNLSLAEKLKSEFGVKLPEMGDAEAFDIEAFFSETERAIAGQKRWSVKPDEMTLGLLLVREVPHVQGPQPCGLARRKRARQPRDHHPDSSARASARSRARSAMRTTSTRWSRPAEVHQVKDADSSQILAILEVNAGRNLVLQGPPGTGKSQTITNIIAECIGLGKKVLFVSEKMAALEVVKRRLDEVGLGDAVLELHSHKTNKKTILEELNRTLHQGRPRVDDASDDIAALTELRDRLNAYCDAVNSRSERRGTHSSERWAER